MPMFAEVVSDRGQGPALVYLPGIDGSGQLLLGTAARIEERFRLIRLRYRLGASPDRATYVHLASSAVEAVSLRGVDRMLIVAESFGGAVGLRAAIDFPATVAGLALVNAFARYGRRTRLALGRLAIAMTPGWMIAAGRRILAPRLLFGGPGERAAIEEFLGGPAPPRREAAQWTLDEGYRARMRMIQQLDLVGELGRVHQPVALFASGRDRIVDAVRRAQEMAERLPDAELEILDGRGHVVLPLAEIDWPGRIERLAVRAGLPGQPSLP